MIMGRLFFWMRDTGPTTLRFPNGWTRRKGFTLTSTILRTTWVTSSQSTAWNSIRVTALLRRKRKTKTNSNSNFYRNTEDPMIFSLWRLSMKLSARRKVMITCPRIAYKLIMGVLKSTGEKVCFKSHRIARSDWIGEVMEIIWESMKKGARLLRVWSSRESAGIMKENKPKMASIRRGNTRLWGRK